jgi:WD40 repeat protein
MLPYDHRGLRLLSPGGRWLVTDSNRDGVLTVWDIESNKPAHHLSVEGAHQIAPVIVSADDRLVAGVARIENRQQIRVWDLAAGKPVFTQSLNTNVEVALLAFPPDGRRLLASYSGPLGVICWDIATGKQLWQDKALSPVTLVITADGLIVTSDVRQPALSLATGQPVRLANDPPLSRLGDSRLALMADGRTVAISTAERVVLWDSKCVKPLRTLVGAGEEIVPFPDGKTVLSNNGLLQRWDVATGRPLWPNNFEAGHLGEVTAVTFTDHGRTLASASTDGTVRLWDVQTGKPLHVWRAHAAQRPPIGLVVLAQGGVRSFAVDREGRRILSAGIEGVVEVWDGRAGRHVRSLPFPQENGGMSPRLLRLHVSPDGRRGLGVFAAVTPAGEVARHSLATWDLDSGKFLRSVPLAPTATAPSAIASDGRTLVATGLLVSSDTGRVTGRLEGVDGSVPDLPFAFSNDGALVVGGATHKLRNEYRFGDGVTVWDTATGKQIAEIRTRSWVTQGAFHPSDRLVATSDTFGVRVWDVETGARVAAPEPLEKVRSYTTGTYATSLAFSPDGGSLAVGQPDGTVLIWSVKPPKRRTDAPSTKELDRLWDALGAADAARAWRAVWHLADCPEAALPLLRARLKPTPIMSLGVIEPLVADLDDKSFERREKASERLRELGHAAEPALRQILKSRLTPEQKRRVEDVLHRLPERPLSAEDLRGVRAAAVVARTDSPEGRRLLEEWRKGPESSPLSLRARALLELSR